MRYAAIYPEDVIAHHRAFIARRRAVIYRMVKTGQPGLAVVAVADALSPAVIPSLVPPGKAETPRWQAPVAPTRRPPLPLIKLAERRKGTAVYGLTTLGHNGRLADGRVFGALGWPSDVRLNIRQSAKAPCVVRSTAQPRNRWSAVVCYSAGRR